MGSNTVPNNWDDFEAASIHEFFLLIVFKGLETNYANLSKGRESQATFRNPRSIVLTIPGVSEEKQFDLFCHALEPDVRLESMKAGV